MKGQSFLGFSDRFKIDGDCKEYLALIKVKKTYKCLKCSHVACQKCKGLSIECNICRHIESLTVNTLFYKVKSWVRITYSWLRDFNINAYFNEFCYRTNRSRFKKNYTR